MDGIDSAGHLEEWAGELRRLTSSREAALKFRQARYRFAHSLAGQLTADGRADGHVVYGVEMDWGPLYVGQTREGSRRIRDLVIGESHHLANTFPPEIWRTVVVIRWPAIPAAAAALAESETDAVGLALEHLLQGRLQPLFNSHKRTRTGGWRVNNYATSQSRAARLAQTAPLLDLAEAVSSLWTRATQNHGPGPLDANCFAVTL